MVTIRSLHGEEMLDAMYNLDMYAFHASPPFSDKQEWAKAVRERRGVTYHALFEHAAAVSGAASTAVSGAASTAVSGAASTAVTGAASTAMTQNIRGKLYPASGVWGVATLPGARRKGYCRQVMASLLAAESEAGKVFSNLYPFRESFYERLGYTTLPFPITAHLTPSNLAPLVKKDFGGEIELKLIGEAFDIYRETIKHLRQNVHGMAFFDIGDQFAADRNSRWVALAKVNGAIEGLMLYSLQGDEISKFKFFASRFYTFSSRGRYLLLDWIARHIDQADRVEIWLPAYEHPETWLADLKIKVESQVLAPMSRVLTVAQLGGMETGAGHFTARIADPLCPFNNGLWLFETVERRLIVSKAMYADCDLTIQGLTALVMGTHDPQDFPLRGWGNPSTELQSVMRRMFPQNCRICTSFFSSKHGEISEFEELQSLR